MALINSRWIIWARFVISLSWLWNMPRAILYQESNQVSLALEISRDICVLFGWLSLNGGPTTESFFLARTTNHCHGLRLGHICPPGKGETWAPHDAQILEADRGCCIKENHFQKEEKCRWLELRLQIEIYCICSVYWGRRLRSFS